MKKRKLRILILTDHTNHTANNSVYDLAQAMNRHPFCGGLDVASRGVEANRKFFYNNSEITLEAVAVTPQFKYEKNGTQFEKNRKFVLLKDYDAVFIRLPHPVADSFFDFLTFYYDEYRIFNRPSGILEVGSKAFLMNMPQFCAPMALCKNFRQVENFEKRFPVVLKPLYSYGGKGLLKVDGNQKFEGDTKISHAEYLRLLDEGFRQGGWLGMKFLRNVKNGDKRIVVVNGKVIGASLRMPGSDSWLCNVAQGGSSGPSTPTLNELEIISHLTPLLLEKGVVMYGIDTIENDNGKRVLSEINAMSIGGLTPMQKIYNKPIIQTTADLLWNYIGKSIQTARPLNH